MFFIAFMAHVFGPSCSFSRSYFRPKTRFFPIFPKNFQTISKSRKNRKQFSKNGSKLLKIVKNGESVVRNGQKCLKTHVFGANITFSSKIFGAFGTENFCSPCSWDPHPFGRKKMAADDPLYRYRSWQCDGRKEGQAVPRGNRIRDWRRGRLRDLREDRRVAAVSYTHLTLPTKA